MHFFAFMTGRELLLQFISSQAKKVFDSTAICRKTLSLPHQLGVPFFPKSHCVRRIKTAEIKPSAPDTDNADTGKRVSSTIPLLIYCFS